MDSTENQDQRFMDAALRLARKHQGLTNTNPSVACVIVNDLGYGPVIVGSAVTAKGGRPHAEPPALEEAGNHARDATAYVTLEPCAHHGKTPPCAQTLIDAGVGRVVTAITDPDERVNGKGHQMLIDAGVGVDTRDGGEFAARVMQGYLKARSGFMPFVTLKVAMDENGMMGSCKKGNMRISCEDSIRQTHLARMRHDAIMVGSGTVLCDDPSLTCRLSGLEDRSPVRVILDAKSRLEPSHQVLSGNMRVQTWVAGNPDAPQDWISMLQQHGARFLPCEMDGDRISLPELLQDLQSNGIQSVMVEGGAELSRSLLDDDLVDEIIIHLGTDPEKPERDEDVVYASFTAENPPSGFTTVQRLHFGRDVSFRMRKCSANGGSV